MSVVNRDRPTFMREAVDAVMAGFPARPICIRTAEQGEGLGSVYVRAAYLVGMLSPEAAERAKAHVAQERLLRDIRAAS